MSKAESITADIGHRIGDRDPCKACAVFKCDFTYLSNAAGDRQRLDSDTAVKGFITYGIKLLGIITRLRVLHEVNCTPADRLDFIGYPYSLKACTPGEGIILYLGDACGQFYAFKGGTVLKGIAADTCYAIGYRKAFKLAAPIEHIIAEGLQPAAQLKALKACTVIESMAADRCCAAHKCNRSKLCRLSEYICADAL